MNMSVKYFLKQLFHLSNQYLLKITDTDEKLLCSFLSPDPKFSYHCEVQPTWRLQQLPDSSACFKYLMNRTPSYEVQEGEKEANVHSPWHWMIRNKLFGVLMARFKTRTTSLKNGTSAATAQKEQWSAGYFMLWSRNGLHKCGENR